jgi:hypothetical protein
MKFKLLNLLPETPSGRYISVNQDLTLGKNPDVLNMGIGTLIPINTGISVLIYFSFLAAGSWSHHFKIQCPVPVQYGLNTSLIINFNFGCIQ